MPACTLTTTLDRKLAMLRLASAALPIGAFAYSQGLECAIAEGAVRNAAHADDWLRGVLEHSVLSGDVPLLARMHAAYSLPDPKRVIDLSDTWRALRSTRELRDEDRQLGLALLRLLAGQGHTPGERASAPRQPTFGFALAFAAVTWGLEAESLALSYCFSWCESQVGAAIRLVPLGQSEGQTILSRLLAIAAAGLESALRAPDDEIASSVPGQALYSSWHETQYTRLFRS